MALTHSVAGTTEWAPRFAEPCARIENRVTRMRRDYDWSEAWDIYEVLKCLGVREVVDVSCGGGELIGFLRSKGFEAVGCDVAITSNSDIMFYCDARRPETIPVAEAWVFQHVLEHVPKEYWLPLFRRAWSGGVKHIVIVAPGHISNDPTHMCNHFTLHNYSVVEGAFGKAVLCSLSELIEALRGHGYTVVWFPDSHSIEAPWSLDYIVIASRAKHLTLRLLPWIARSGIALWLLIKLLKKLQKRLRKPFSSIYHTTA